MRIAPTQRVLMAWLLYGCVLFSSFACAIGHGQSSGLQLSGIAQLQCSISGASDSRVPPLGQPLASFECPLCGSHALTARSIGYGLQLPPWQPNLHAALQPVQQDYRDTLWPAANPRAPPIL
jgi:hypothetical protein